MAYFTITLKIKHTVKAGDKEEAVEAFFSELQELHDAGDLEGKIKVVKSTKNADTDTDDEGEEDDE